MMKLVCLFVIFGLLAVSIAQQPVAVPPRPSIEPHSFEVPLARTDIPFADSPRSLEPETEVQRNFEFGFSSDQIDARIQLRANGTEHELRHQIGAAATGAEFIVEFEQNVNDTKSTLRMRLRLFELIEYIPDTTPGYQNETVVHSYRYWNWGKGLVDTTPSSNDSKIYTLKTADKLFGLVIRINKPENGTLTINPEDVKFDIEFDVQALRAAGWLNGTEVALKAVVVSRLESEKQHDDDSKQTENSINVGSSNSTASASLFFTWVNYVNCDANTVSVVSSSLRVDDTLVESDDDSDSTAHVVAFAFINLKDQSNTTCVWDPVVSASAADTTSSSSSSSPTSTTTTTTASSDAASVVASLAVFAAAIATLF